MAAKPPASPASPRPNFARKDGLYHPLFSKAETAELLRTHPDLVDEIGLMRLELLRMAREIQASDTFVDDNLKRFTAMTALSRAIGYLMHYQWGIDHPRSPMDADLEAALRSHAERWTLA